jgi:hypothetical protein
MPTRAEVFTAIESERDYQQKRWPGHVHGTGSYLAYIDSYLRKAVNTATCSSDDAGTMDVIRKIVALCVACMEENGVWTRFGSSYKVKYRREVYDVIDGERGYQAQTWPDADDPDNTQWMEVSEELTLMRVYLRKAEEEWASFSGNRAGLDNLRKLAAIGVRCMEHHGAPLREIKG